MAIEDVLGDLSAISHTPEHYLLGDALELAGILKPAWAAISADIPEWHPRNEGEGESDSDADDATDDKDDDAEKAGDADDDKSDGDAGTEPDWKAMARKHERRAKQEKKEREALAAKLKEREDADKSEAEKALEAAREEGRTAALTEAQKERRSDRLEVAVTRLAARGIEVKLGDDTKTLKFADPEDALVFIERAIAKGDLDEDDVFDEDHKVKPDEIEDALRDLLRRKPRLAADENGGSGAKGKGSGDADLGKGKGAGKDWDTMSVEDHIKRRQVAAK